jgi:hypothetical protein
MATKQLTQAFDEIEAKYKSVLKMCYDALAEDAPQENRDAIRDAIESFINDEEAGVQD